MVEGINFQPPSQPDCGSYSYCNLANPAAGGIESVFFTLIAGIAPEGARFYRIGYGIFGGTRAILGETTEEEELLEKTAKEYGLDYSSGNRKLRVPQNMLEAVTGRLGMDPVNTDSQVLARESRGRWGRILSG